MGAISGNSEPQQPSSSTSPRACVRLFGGILRVCRRVGRQIVQHDPDARCLGIVDINQIAHALGEVICGSAFGDFHLSPATVCIEEDEQFGGAIALVFAVVAQEFARLGRNQPA